MDAVLIFFLYLHLVTVSVFEELQNQLENKESDLNYRKC
jgi:hypothetical protein